MRTEEQKKARRSRRIEQDRDHWREEADRMTRLYDETRGRLEGELATARAGLKASAELNGSHVERIAELERGLAIEKELAARAASRHLSDMREVERARDELADECQRRGERIELMCREREAWRAYQVAAVMLDEGERREDARVRKQALRSIGAREASA